MLPRQRSWLLWWRARHSAGWLQAPAPSSCQGKNPPSLPAPVLLWKARMRTIEMVVPVVEILRPIFHADLLIGVGRDRSQLNDPALEMQPATLDPEKNLSSGIRGSA